MKWYNKLIIGLSIGIHATFFLSLAVTFYILGVLEKKEEKANEETLTNIYASFKNISSEKQIFYCLDQYEEACNGLDTIKLSDIEDDIKRAAPKNLNLNSNNMIFVDYVFSTKNDCFLLYEVNHSIKTESYLVFKKAWERDDSVSFVASLENIPRTNTFPVFSTNYIDGFSFYVYNSTDWDLYRFSINDKTFSYIETVKEAVNYNSFNNISVKSIKEDKDVIEIEYSENAHLTSFSETCQSAFNATKRNNFLPFSVYQLNSMSLCLFKKTFGALDRRDVFAVFSYDWDNDIESFQGLFVQRSECKYRFMRIFDI